MHTILTRKRGKSWQFRFYIYTGQGRKEICKSGFRTKKEAMLAGEEAHDMYTKGGLSCLQGMNMVYADFLDYWMENYVQVNLKGSTCSGYDKRLCVIKPRLGNYSLHALTPMVLQTFINQLFQEGYSRNSLSCYKGILSGSLSYAVSPAGLLQTNPMAAVRLPHYRARPKKLPRHKERKPITVEQWSLIMKRFPQEHPSHIALNLGYHLGLRLGEAFGLMWEDIDFDQGIVSVKRQVQWSDDAHCWEFTDPKYDSFRTMVMDMDLLSLLRTEYERQEKAKAYYGQRYHQIFADENGRLGEKGRPVWLVNTRENGTFIQPRSLQHTSHVIHSELNMPAFDFHSLRHTHATMLLESGANPLDVQERLGHTKLFMTWRYAHDTDAMREKTRGILDALYSPKF